MPIAIENADSYAGAATGKLSNLWNPWLGKRTNTCVHSRALGRKVLQQGFHSARDWILARARTCALSRSMIPTLKLLVMKSDARRLSPEDRLLFCVLLSFPFQGVVLGACPKRNSKKHFPK